MTIREAKALIKAELERRGLPFTKLTAKTLDFTDLARARTIFVEVHGWQANPVFVELAAFARQRGFRLTAKGMF